MPTKDRTERIAIVGLGGVFPGALELDSFWSNIASGIDTGRHVPAGRWYLDPRQAVDPRGPRPDRVYSDWGCFIEDFQFDPTGLDLDLELLHRLDPLFHLGLHAARAAVRHAGYLAGTERSRVGVILGNIVLPTESTSALCRDILGRTLLERLARTLQSFSEHQFTTLPTINRTLRCGDWHPANRLAASLPAALIATGLGLGGPAYTLDAACASSLYALKYACEELLDGRADAMLAGGMSRPDCQYTQMGFAQLKALSRRGCCAPLSAAADGLVVGEGAGVFVLKRLSDAVNQGDRVYGLIAGIGLSNDRGANLLAPHSEGQLRAMRSAYQQAGWKPSDVDLIECHATGTPVGDAVEIDSLHQLWANETTRTGQCVIGGVKSNVGHLLTGAGAAGLMKVLLALHHETLPPTANFVEPADALARPDSPFRVLTSAEPWRRRQNTSGPGQQSAPVPRRATINAFGFGGINAHVLIEEFIDSRPAPSISTTISLNRGPDRSHSLETPPAAAPFNLATEAPLNIAIIGIATESGEPARFKNSLSSIRSVSSEPNPHVSDWGVEQSEWYRRELAEDAWDKLCPITEVHLPLGKFRIPPLEMQDMLPQQQLMLQVAAAALEDSTQQLRSQIPAADASSLGIMTGVFVGIELDPNTTNFHFRWSIEELAPKWATELGLDLSPEELSVWIGRLQDAVSPPLSANRVMGNLGGIVASRLAREFQIGGPSFTISAAENSGLRAVAMAAQSLRRNELDRAIVGAVDLVCDIRNRVAILRTPQHPRDSLCDRATALVLKRLEDAVRDGDRIHAVIATVTTSSAGRDLSRPVNPLVSNGASIGLYELTTAVKSLRDQIRLNPTPAYWLHNRIDGPRECLVSGIGVDGGTLQFRLVEVSNESASPEHARTSSEGIRIGRTFRRLPAGLFVIDGNSSEQVLNRLTHLEEHSRTADSIQQLARDWWISFPPQPDRPVALTLVIKSLDEISDVVRSASRRVLSPAASDPIDRRVFWSHEPLGINGRLAFVFPGSGNAFLGMGRELFATFPDVLRRQHSENQRLKDQYRPDLVWYGDSTAGLLEDHKAMIFGQVALGTAVCDLLDLFGIRPEASIGYSLGESAALFGLRAWTDRDEMLQRMDAATLFGSDLVAPFRAARRAWNCPPEMTVPWVSGVIDRSPHVVRRALAEIAPPQRAYLLIINSPSQCVIGGERSTIQQLIQHLQATFVPFAAPSTVHCDIVRQVEPAYRALHQLPTSVPTGPLRRSGVNPSPQPISFYSTAWGRSYDLTSQSATEAIVAQALSTIDFPRVIEQAYADGVRIFVEIGPGSSCTRMIDEILSSHPHLAQAATPSTSTPVLAFLELLAALIAERIPVDLTSLYEDHEDQLHQPAPDRPADSRHSEIVTRTGGRSFQIPAPPHGWRMQTSPPTLGINIMSQFDDLLDARTKAHETYLRVSAEAQRMIAEQVALFAKISGAEEIFSQTSHRAAPETPIAVPAPESIPVQEPAASHVARRIPPRSLNREECLEFAIGKIGRALGEQFAEIDQFPTRVRLPDEPLMLVDRILEIDGDPLSMTSGRVVTEHDVLPNAWYLDCNRIPTCIAVEAGQADLFLSGWLGIDLQTRGMANYRLLDAVVTFHKELPVPGQTIHYDIRINHFFRQGQTYLFRFEFDATVDGQPLLTMREGCAGFFTEAELSGGKGIIQTALDRQPRPGKRPADWRELVAMSSIESYDDAQLLALRRGNLAECFGPAFASLNRQSPSTLPGLSQQHDGLHRTRMWLVDRILKLDPTGGKFGIGSILGELDIHPDDWFLTCHFCDDQVMPGTLMYECCMHTLRIFLLRMGWIGESGEVAYEPIPGVRSRLKCRGQVLAGTQKVWYEITIKEVGYARPQTGDGSHDTPSVNAAPLDDKATPFCLADALMYADGKPIVEITDMSVRLSGLTRKSVERLWAESRNVSPPVTLAPAVPSTGSMAGAATEMIKPRYDRRPALFDTDRITAFAIGLPSVAFGDRYRIFDAERVIARLPGPPFQFLDRIVSIDDCEPWVLKPGGKIVAQYDVPSDAWYFAANRQARMPFSVLLETALQPCGWLAAYVGSALSSEIDISFRNLGGSAVQYQDVTAASGTLTTTVKMTRMSNSGGMIIQHYDFDLRCNDQPVYVGNTYFGFFSRSSLLNQIGIREARPFAPGPVEAARAHRFAYPDQSPFADSRLQMVDEIQLSLSDGPFGHGFAVGTTNVNPSSWFFKAHFYQDPVVPGSLGLESFFQLLKLYAVERWKLSPEAQFQTPLVERTEAGISGKHEWVYRGQVIPRDKQVTVSAVIKSVDDGEQRLTAEGYLSVDGRVIYQMKEFSLGVVL